MDSSDRAEKYGRMTARNGASALVSVIIPTYYRNDLLTDAIRSVLEQSYRPIEIIVIDDSGEGHARPVMSDFDDVRYVAFDSNRGGNAARTAGVQRASGQYIHFLDDDDRMYEKKIERQVRLIERTTDVGVVYTGIEKKDDQTDLPDPKARGDVLEHALMFEMWPCMTSTMLIDSRVLEEVLPFSEKRGATALEQMIQFAQLTEFGFVDAPLLYKRIDLPSTGASMTAVEGRKHIIDEYDDLYASYPDRVRNTALANTYETEGVVLLQNQGWSPKAILSFVKHVYYMPNEKLKSVSKLVAACFGRPGWTVVNRVNRVLTAGGR